MAINGEELEKPIMARTQEKRRRDKAEQSEQADGKADKMGSVGAKKSSLLSSLTDNTDFKAWIKENLQNADFKQFGKDNHMEAVKDLWYQKRAEEELKNLHEIPIEDAISQVKDSINDNIIRLWFLEANSDVKPKLVDSIMQTKGTLNAGFNIAYNNYKNAIEIQNIQNHTNEKPLSFNKWLTTPQTMYRGEYGQKHVDSDIFLSYTRDKNIALKFGKSLSTIKIRPIDTWGSYQTTAEQEFLVPVRKLKK